ncbi:MAG: hypothetical protein GX184_03225 [Clostridiaceae bacterium]|nr:hypothetical protein [Clostridiaceae bacterium]
MAKKLSFLLVFIFALIAASVTAFAAGTESTTPEAGFTEEKIQVEEDYDDFIEALEEKYKDIFFDENASSTAKIVEQIKYKRSASVIYSKRHVFNCRVSEAKYDDPVVLLMYIKIDGKYKPLEDVDSGDNYTIKPHHFSTKVDLEYIGANAVNEVRAILFRKSAADNLELNKNVQIVDFEIAVREWTLIEKANIAIPR